MKRRASRDERRDDFSDDVRRTLAARAGHRCSVCSKCTAGPGGSPDAALSDGVAAHITAASRDGPRFDPFLTPDERRAIGNGVWACTRCGREIDADTAPFSVDVLRGLKWKREEAAYRDFHARDYVEDPSVLLIDFPYVESKYKLFEILNAQPYTYRTTSALRDDLRASDTRSSPLLDLATELIPEISDREPKVAGILSTLLSTNIDLWQPTARMVCTLESICHDLIVDGNWTRVALIEPLAFAVAAKGHADVHRQFLKRFLEDRHWRETIVDRDKQYYETLGARVAAIRRHWRDPIRAGLLRANDTARLIDLLLSMGNTLGTSASSRASLIDLLDQNAHILASCGEVELARRVGDFLAAVCFEHTIRSQPEQTHLIT